MVLDHVIQMDQGHSGGLFMGTHWVWWLSWVLILFGALWAFARLYGERAETRRRRRAEDAAEEALRTRFAAGEIDEEEFSERLRVLRTKHSGR